LLDRGAPVNVADDTHGGTPLEWALYAWGNRGLREQQRGSYYKTVALLVRAGSTVDPRWLDGDPERQRAAGGMRSDLSMAAALRGEIP
jgi:ankyrin repeat protein